MNLTSRVISIAVLLQRSLWLDTTRNERETFMGKIALLPGDSRSRAKYLGNKKLPENYMGDFTLMGFVVDQYQEALMLLKSAGYRLDEQADSGTDICIDTPRNIQEIQDLLTINNVRCDFSDVADTIYQA